MTRQTFELVVDDGWARTKLAAAGVEDLGRLDGPYVATFLSHLIETRTALRVVRCDHVGQASELGGEKRDDDRVALSG